MTETVPTMPSNEGQLSILVVDDDPLVREVTAWMLTDAGHRVHEAEDGVAALEFLTSGGLIDLMITDINMPHMDGLELMKEARARWPWLPILLVSGRPQPPGTQAFMSKPFGWDTLVQAVGRVVPRRGEETRATGGSI